MTALEPRTARVELDLPFVRCANCRARNRRAEIVAEPPCLEASIFGHILGIIAKSERNDCSQAACSSHYLLFRCEYSTDQCDPANPSDY